MLNFTSFLLEQNREVQLTFDDLLEVFLSEDRATWVGWIGDNQTGSPLVNKTLQML